VGVILLLSPYDMVIIEVSLLDFSFAKLKESSKDQPVRNQFNAIGRAFFNWVKKERPNWDNQKINSVFSQRVAAFCQDMQKYLQDELDIQIKSIMIGGGNSRLIADDLMHKATKKQIILLAPQSTSRFGVSPDIISLLGCLNSSDYNTIKCIPSLEEIAKMCK